LIKYLALFRVSVPEHLDCGRVLMAIHLDRLTLTFLKSRVERFRDCLDKWPEIREIREIDHTAAWYDSAGGRQEYQDPADQAALERLDACYDNDDELGPQLDALECGDLEFIRVPACNLPSVGNIRLDACDLVLQPATETPGEISIFWQAVVKHTSFLLETGTLLSQDLAALLQELP
jgi:hypothetical protein